ncbi:MAG: DUF2721 domain-containing protein [Fibrobacter sp.]|nr:DUF2721 domain-containing protein [Fibrobacter sp.]
MNHSPILTLTTPTLLFSVISLLLLAYTNRFLALAALVRELHKQYTLEAEDVILAQIKSLRFRIILIRNMQFLGVISFFLCTVCMFMIFFNYSIAAEVTFILALVALMLSLLVSAWEIHISYDALNLRLRDIEEGEKPQPLL